MSEMNLKSSEIINENKVKSYQPKGKNLESLNYEASENRKPLAPQVSYRDGPIVNLQLEDIGVLGINSTKLKSALPSVASSQGSVGNLVITILILVLYQNSMFLPLLHTIILYTLIKMYMCQMHKNL
jgi:hypothetical protein